MKKQSKAIIVVIFVVILLLQTISIVYATSKREYYHIDEYYSHGLIQYKRAFIFDNEDFIKNWHSKEYFEDYLTINENEKLNFSSVYTNQAEDVHPPLYYLLLRIACSFNINEFSIWPGTILNIILFIASSIILFLIAKEIFKNSYYALLVCFITGFSLASIETVMYVRMYQLLILNILVLIYWHIRKKNKDILAYKDLVPLFFMIILGFLTHYYYCIIVVALFIMYVIKYLKQKQQKNMIHYIFTIVAAALSGICIFPYSILHIFFSYRGKDVTTNLTNTSIMLKKIKENLKLINAEAFINYGKYLILFLFITTILWIIFNKKNKKYNHVGAGPVSAQENNANPNTGIIYITIPLIFYLIIIILGSPYVDLRYIMPAVPLMFCLIIYILKDLLQDIASKKIVFFILLIISICFVISTMPKLSNNSYTYKGHKEVLNYIEENLQEKPLIFIYDDVSAGYNKIMECYEALTKIDNTYIMLSEELTVDNIKECLKDMDTSNGITLMSNYVYGEELFKEIEKMEQFKEQNYVGKLGRYQIFELK